MHFLLPTLQVRGPCRVSCNKPSIAKTVKQHFLKAKPSQAASHITHKDEEEAVQPTQELCVVFGPGSEAGAAATEPPPHTLQPKPSISPLVNQASAPQPLPKPAPKSMPLSTSRRTFSADDRSHKLASLLAAARSKGQTPSSSSSTSDGPAVHMQSSSPQQSESIGPGDDIQPTIHLYAFGSWHAGGVAVRTS